VFPRHTTCFHPISPPPATPHLNPSPTKLLQDDSRIISASGDSTLRLWDTAYANRIATFSHHCASVKTVAASPCRPWMFASGGRDGAVMLWDDRVAAAGEIRHGSLGAERATLPVAIIEVRFGRL
jgi:WD40 repeat protein